MFWAQIMGSFAVWLAYGVLLARRSASVRRQLLGMSSMARGLGGALLMVLSLALLVGALGLIQWLGGLREGSMSPGIWMVVTILGVAFVHSQAIATGMLVTLAQESVTPPQAGASSTRNSQEEGPL